MQRRDKTFHDTVVRRLKKGLAKKKRGRKKSS